MPTPTSALSSYRSGARALAAKSALPLAAGAAAALLAPAAHAGVVVTIPTSGNVADLGTHQTQIGLNFFTGANAYGGLGTDAGDLVIYTQHSGSGDGIRAGLNFPYYHNVGDSVGRVADAYATNAGSSYPGVFARGDTIDASTFYYRAADSAPYLNGDSISLAPAWANTTGYIAVELFKNSNTYYGWLKLQVNNDGSRLSLLAFGYNTIPGASITAGEGLAAPVPEPATSAALLALGAAGLVAYRKRKNLQRAA